jgi:chromosome segregation ATPase
MAEATNDLLYELLKSIHQRMDRFEVALSEIKQELTSVRLSVMGIQTDIHNIYGILARHDERLDRIERRLDLREFAEPQRPIQP